MARLRGPLMDPPRRRAGRGLPLRLMLRDWTAFGFGLASPFATLRPASDCADAVVPLFWRRFGGISAGGQRAGRQSHAAARPSTAPCSPAAGGRTSRRNARRTKGRVGDVGVEGFQPLRPPRCRPPGGRRTRGASRRSGWLEAGATVPGECTWPAWPWRSTGDASPWGKGSPDGVFRRIAPRGGLLEHSWTPPGLVMDPPGPWQQGSTRCAEQSAGCDSIQHRPDMERRPA